MKRRRKMERRFPGGSAPLGLAAAQPTPAPLHRRQGRQGFARGRLDN